jgi:hypothetical protein
MQKLMKTLSASLSKTNQNFVLIEHLHDHDLTPKHGFTLIVVLGTLADSEIKFAA